MAANEQTFGLWGIKLFGDIAGLKVDLDKAMGMAGKAASSMGGGLASIARATTAGIGSAFQSMGSIAGSVLGGIKDVIFNLKTAILGVLGAGGFIALFQSAVNTGDEINKMSQRVAIGAETLSGYRLAAGLADISMDDFGRSLQIASRNIMDASKGTGEAGKAFDDLGISVTDSNGKVKTAEQVMLEVADKFSQMEDGAKKTAFAMDIFGRSGAFMIPMLNQGRKALEDQRKEAELFGATFTSVQAKASEEFNDTVKRIGEAFIGFRNTVAMSLLPFLNEIVGGIIETMKEWAASGDLKVWAKATSDYIIDAFIAAARGMDQVVLATASILDGFRGLMAGTRMVETVIEAAAGALFKVVEKIMGALSWLAELIGKADTFRAAERAAKSWGDTATTAAVQAADAAGEWWHAVGSSNATAEKLAGTLSRVALKVEVWGEKAKAAGSNAAKGAEEAKKKISDLPSLLERLKADEDALKAARTRGEATYQDELNFLQKRAQAMRSGSIDRVQAEADAFKMAKDIADRMFAHDQALGLKSLRDEIERQRQKADAAVAGSEARMKAEEDVFKKEEELKNKRRSGALGIVGEAAKRLEEKGITGEIGISDLQREIQEMGREEARKAAEAGAFAGGKRMTIESLKGGLEAAGRLESRGKIIKEGGGLGELIGGGAAVQGLSPDILAELGLTGGFAQKSFLAGFAPEDQSKLTESIAQPILAGATAGFAGFDAAARSSVNRALEEFKRLGPGVQKALQGEGWSWSGLARDIEDENRRQ